MMGPRGLFWQPAFVLDIIMKLLCMLIWVNKDVCLLA